MGPATNVQLSETTCPITAAPSSMHHRASPGHSQANYGFIACTVLCMLVVCVSLLASSSRTASAAPQASLTLPASAVGMSTLETAQPVANPADGTDSQAGDLRHQEPALLPPAPRTPMPLPSTVGKSASPNLPDLDVTHITRDPRYRRDAAKGWPDPGEPVTFTAHVRNQGFVPSQTFQYAWTLDGVSAGAGSGPVLAVGQEVTYTLGWLWAADPANSSGHTVGFVVTPTSGTEITVGNNSLVDFVAALSLNIYADQTAYDEFRGLLNIAGSYSWQDFVQREVRIMNERFAQASYPVSPQGIRMRVRIDRVEIVPDGTLWCGGDHHIEANGPDTYADGEWGFAICNSGDIPFIHWIAPRGDPGLRHEWGHYLLGMPDLYILNAVQRKMDVRDLYGDPVRSSFSFPCGGLMGGGDTSPYCNSDYYSSVEAYGLNTVVGLRHTWWAPWTYDTPAENYIRILDNSGQPLAGVTVTLHQERPWGAFYESIYDNQPTITVTTGADGRALLPNRPVSPASGPGGHVRRPNPFGDIEANPLNGQMFVRAVKGGYDSFDWLNITQFNLAYAADPARGEYTFLTHLPPSGAPQPPTAWLERWEGNGRGGHTGVLHWSAVGAAAGYHVYRADEPERWLYRRIITATTSLSATLDTPNVLGRIYVVTTLDAEGRESGFSRRVVAPTLEEPWGVCVDSSGHCIIADHGIQGEDYGYADDEVLVQRADGSFWKSLVRDGPQVAGGLPRVRYMGAPDVAIDPWGRLLVPHPGDAFQTDSLVVLTVHPETYDVLDAQWWGSPGAGPGQFSNPTSVIADGAGHILVSDTDNHRIQVFDLFGNFLAEFGSQGAGPQNLSHPGGLGLDPTGRLLIADTDNNRVQILRYDGVAFTYIATISGLMRPADVCSDSDGHIIVADTENNRVAVFTSQGALVTTYTAPDLPYSGTFLRPRGVAVEWQNRIIVSDTGNQRIVTVSRSAPATPQATPTSGNTPTCTPTPSPTPTATTFPGSELAGSAWPMYKHDTRHTGLSLYGGPQLPVEAAGFPAGGAAGWLFASPCIGPDGTVYCGSSDGHLYAIQPDGSVKWRSATTSDGISGAPAISAGGTVYFGTGDGDGHLYALDAEGRLLWAYPTDGGITSPTIGRDGTVYFGSRDNYLYAVWPTGALRWRYRADSWIHSAPALGSDGAVYFGSTDWHVYTLNPDGTLRWRYNAGNYVDAAPTLGDDGTLYVGAVGGTLLALNADGTRKWSYAAGGTIGGGVSIGPDGTLFIGSHDHKVYAIWPDGSLRWEYTTGGTIDTGTAVDRDGNVYVSSQDGYLYALSSAGALRWRLNLGVFNSSPAIAADGTLFVNSWAGVHALRSAPTPTNTLTPTPTPTLTETASPTPTSTSERPAPLPPELTSPEDGALLPQPVPPGEWVFQWSWPGGASVWYYTIVITGPGARQIMSDVYGYGYTYHYTSTEYVPDEALGPWYWRVIAHGLGAYPKTTSSETRTFSVMSASTPTPTPTVTPTLPYDLDSDCDVDIVDIMLVAARWGLRPGDPNYDLHYDLDSDGDIDIVDIMLVAAHWGERCGQSAPHSRALAPQPRMILPPIVSFSNLGSGSSGNTALYNRVMSSLPGP